MAHVKVLLNERVEKLGEVGDLVNVRAGYARNFLLPNKLASLPTLGELKRLEKKRKLLEEKLKEEKAKAEDIAKKINELGQLEITAKAGEAGKLFGSITTKDITEAIKDKADIELARKEVLLKKSITELGEYNVKIKLHSEVTTELKIVVKKEEE